MGINTKKILTDSVGYQDINKYVPNTKIPIKGHKLKEQNPIEKTGLTTEEIICIYISVAVDIKN
jgi:hypothetical protein